MKSTSFTLAKAKKLFASIFVLLTLTIGITSCLPDATDPETTSVDLPQSIVGTWQSSYGDKYIISDDKLINTYTDVAGAQYSLNVIDIKQIEGTENNSYYLYLQSPEDYSYEYSGITYYYYHKNYYTAFYIEVLSDSTLKISGACNSTTWESENSDYDTVLSDFTLGNGYFGNQPEYTLVTE